MPPPSLTCIIYVEENKEIEITHALLGTICTHYHPLPVFWPSGIPRNDGGRAKVHEGEDQRYLKHSGVAWVATHQVSS